MVLRDAGGLGIVVGLQNLRKQGGKRGGVRGFGVAVRGGLPYAETEYDACAIEFGAQGSLAVGGWARLASVRGISGFQAAFGQRAANRFSGYLVSNFIVKRVLR